MINIVASVTEIGKITEFNSAYCLLCNPESIDGENGFVNADKLIVVVPNATYSTLVSAFIHTKYSIDDELAILANHAADPTNVEHLATYNEYQAWREEVKTACREHFNIQ